MANCGSTTWTSANGYALGDELNNSNKWGVARAGLISSTSPGQQATFNFTIQCPSAVGNYELKWKMVQESVQWFGQYNSPTTITCNTTATPVVGDINLDHIVNSIDYSILNSRWFTADAAADLNDDGIVNGIDYSILNSNWFRTW
jgi:hypothetical protein